MLPHLLWGLPNGRLNIVIYILNIVKLGLDILKKIWYNIRRTIRNSLNQTELT
jgi:hypothetical protein